MSKDLAEMTEAELRAFCERQSGIAFVRPGASQAERDRWMVAYLIACAMRLGATADEAVLEAAADLARGEGFARYRPHLEEALGRPLTAADLVPGGEAMAGAAVGTAAQAVA